MKRRRWLLLALAVLVVVLAALAVPAHRWVENRRACSQVEDNADAAPEQLPGDGPTVAIIGDSWTSGWLLNDPQDSFAYQLAEGAGWNTTVDGFAGSGYVNASRCGEQRFAARVETVPADASMVIVEGGLNDVEDAAQVGGAARKLLADLADRAPEATVVIVGPPAAAARAGGALREITAALAREADEGHAVWVDTSTWRLPYLKDGLHLTADGHAEFADRLAAELPQR